METISRQDARSRGQKTYFTGEPCKNGHVAYRYVQSGTCSQCLRASNSQTVDVNAGARREASAQLVQVKIRLHRVDLELFKAAAYAMALARFPVLQVGDVYPGYLPMDCDSLTGLYKFNCHVEDVEQMRAIGCDMVKAHRADVALIRRQAFGVAGDKESAPVPDWARIPQPGDFDYK